MSGQLSNTIINEVQKHVMPIIAGKLEGIKTQIQSDIAQKITVTDHVIKENITNICRNKVNSTQFITLLKQIMTNCFSFFLS